jgi:hypothetical protein
LLLRVLGYWARVPAHRVHHIHGLEGKAIRCEMLIRSDGARQRRIYTDEQHQVLLTLLGDRLRLPKDEIIEGFETFGDAYSTRMEASLPAEIVRKLTGMATALDKIQRDAEEGLALPIYYYLDDDDADRAAEILGNFDWLREALLRAAVPEQHGGLACEFGRRDHSPKTLSMMRNYQHLAEVYARAMPDGPDDIRHLKMPSKDVHGQYQGHVIDFFEACITSLPRCAGTSRTGIAKRFIRMVLQREP